MLGILQRSVSTQLVLGSRYVIWMRSTYILHFPLFFLTFCTELARLTTHQLTHRKDVTQVHHTTGVLFRAPLRSTPRHSHRRRNHLLPLSTRPSNIRKEHLGVLGQRSLCPALLDATQRLRLGTSLQYRQQTVDRTGSRRHSGLTKLRSKLHLSRPTPSSFR